MVPRGVAFPHYENFCYSYHQLNSAWQQGSDCTKVSLADVQSRPRGRVEASGNYSGTELWAESGFGQVSTWIRQWEYYNSGWLWLNSTPEIFSVQSADSAVYKCKLSLIICVGQQGHLD